MFSSMLNKHLIIQISDSQSTRPIRLVTVNVCNLTRL
jgi:hypothetical protein